MLSNCALFQVVKASICVGKFFY